MLQNLKGLDDSDEESSNNKDISAKKPSGQTNASKYTSQEFEDSTQKESSKQMSKNIQPIQENADQNEIAIDEDDDDSNEEEISAQFEQAKVMQKAPVNMQNLIYTNQPPQQQQNSQMAQQRRHKAYVNQVNQNDLQAQLYIRNVQDRQKKLKKQKLVGAQEGTMPKTQFRRRGPPTQAFNTYNDGQTRIKTAPTGAIQHQNQQMLHMQPGNALSADPDNQQEFIQETDMEMPMPPGFNYPGAPTGPTSANFPMSSKMQRQQDRKKTEWDLNMEVEDLKKQRNKDNNDIKLLKVELNKLEKLFKQYKDIAPTSGAERNPINVPDFQQMILNKIHQLGMSPQTQISLSLLETEDMLIEVQSVKMQLQKELSIHKRFYEQQANRQQKSTMFVPSKQQTDHSKPIYEGVSLGGGTVNYPGDASHHVVQQRQISPDEGQDNSKYNQAPGNPFNSNFGQMSQHMNKSSMRLQLGALKRKVKQLEQDIASREEEIDRLKEKTSQKAQDHMRKELRKSYDVLRHLKKKVGGLTYNEEFKVVVKGIREVLDINGPSSPMKIRKSIQNPQPYQQNAPIRQDNWANAVDQQLVSEHALPDAEADFDIYKKSYLTIYSQQKPKLIRDNILVLLMTPDFFKFSMLSKQMHKMINPAKVNNQHLMDYNWLLETRIGLDPSRAVIVLKNINLINMPARLDQGYKSNMKKVLEAGIESKRKQDNNEDEENVQVKPKKTVKNKEEEQSEDDEIDPNEQEEITYLEQKLADLQSELALPRQEFEQRLMRRLREEVQTNRAKLEDDLKKQFITEKKRLLRIAAAEKKQLNTENGQLQDEIGQLKGMFKQQQK